LTLVHVHEQAETAPVAAMATPTAESTDEQH
jgi:hypothetical protein